MDHVSSFHGNSDSDHEVDVYGMCHMYFKFATLLFQSLYGQVLEVLQVFVLDKIQVNLIHRAYADWYHVATVLDFSEGPSHFRHRNPLLEVSEARENLLASQLLQLVKKFPSVFSKVQRLIHVTQGLRSHIKPYILKHNDHTSFEKKYFAMRNDASELKPHLSHLQSIIIILESQSSLLQVKQCLYSLNFKDRRFFFFVENARHLTTFNILFWYVFTKNPDIVRLEGSHPVRDFDDWTMEQAAAFGKKTKHPGPEHERYVRITRHFEERLRKADSAQKYGALVNEVAAILQEPE